MPPGPPSRSPSPRSHDVTGVTWNAGVGLGEEWLVGFRHHGRFVALSDASVEEYEDLQALHDGRKVAHITFL